MGDEDLRTLLISELRKHDAQLARPDADLAVARRCLNSAMGSAGLAGERDLCDALLRAERRVASDPRTAVAQARAILQQAIANLQGGGAGWKDSWPAPPSDLVPFAPTESLARYQAEMRDRIAVVDRALDGAIEPCAAVQEAFRSRISA